MTTPQAVLKHLLDLAQRDPAPDDDVMITGHDPALPTNYLLGTAGAAVIAATGVAASDLWHIRHLAPAVQLSETPPRWTRPPAPFGTHEPVWPA